MLDPDIHFHVCGFWKRDKHWLEDHHPAGINGLNPGATSVELDQLESVMGVGLPEEYRAFHSIHNGQRPESPAMLNDMTVFPTHEVARQWTGMNQLLQEGAFSRGGRVIRGRSSPRDYVRSVWWSARWIPVAGEPSGNLLCLDMDPAEKGRVGQLIYFDHETPERFQLAEMFSD